MSLIHSAQNSERIRTRLLEIVSTYSFMSRYLLFNISLDKGLNDHLWQTILERHVPCCCATAVTVPIRQYSPHLLFAVDEYIKSYIAFWTCERSWVINEALLRILATGSTNVCFRGSSPLCHAASASLQLSLLLPLSLPSHFPFLHLTSLPLYLIHTYTQTLGKPESVEVLVTVSGFTGLQSYCF